MFGFNRKPKHEHDWDIDGFFVQRYYGGGADTILMVQCTTCGHADEKKIAKVRMNQDQVLRWIKLNFDKDYVLKN